MKNVSPPFKVKTTLVQDSKYVTQDREKKWHKGERVQQKKWCHSLKLFLCPFFLQLNFQFSVFPLYLHGISIISPWYLHYISMVFPLNLHGISIISPWYLHGISWGSHNVTVTNNKNTSKRLSVRLEAIGAADIAILPDPKHYNSTILST